MAGLTIVMYHYVRDLRRSRYPEIKGLPIAEFEEQIQYIKRHYNVVSGEHLMDSIVEGAPLPPRPLLLTFDDGYLDDFTTVFPILDREKLPGCFFPPARCVLEDKVLDVNKIHFILASTPEKRTLVEHIFRQIEHHQSDYQLPSPARYWDMFGTPNRFDSAEVVFCKRMLQVELPLELRQAITDGLFAECVTRDEASFSRELYMTLDQLVTLRSHGMYIGSHGYDHFWMNDLSTRQQEVEVDRSLAFLQSLGADVHRWIMCYPYGMYDESLLSVVAARRCVAGLTTDVGVARIGEHNPLTLPRLDTNDLPKDSNAGSDSWAARAAGEN